MGHTAGRERGLAVALDIGGTKTVAALVSERGEILGSATVATRGGDADLLGGMEKLVFQVAGPAGLGRVSGLGISSAGPIDLASGTVAPVNIPELRGLPLLEHMAALVPGRAARLLGDGLAAAAGEHWIGAGRGFEDLLAIVVSTGVGGGLVLRGRLHGGASGNAGHVGHAPVVMDGDPCPCGGAGCPEAYASGPSMVAFAVRNGWRTRRAPTARRWRRPLAAGSRSRCWRSSAVRGALAAMIAAAAATCDVRRVVIGGGVAGAGAVLMDPLRRSLGRHLSLAFLAGLEVVPAGLGARASLVGPRRPCTGRIGMRWRRSPHRWCVPRRPRTEPARSRPDGRPQLARAADAPAGSSARRSGAATCCPRYWRTTGSPPPPHGCGVLAHHRQRRVQLFGEATSSNPIGADGIGRAGVRGGPDAAAASVLELLLPRPSTTPMVIRSLLVNSAVGGSGRPISARPRRGRRPWPAARAEQSGASRTPRDDKAWV